MTNGRGTDRVWAPVSTCLRKTIVKVGNLIPGTQYDFRARGGYRSELPGVEDTLGDFSVVSTLQTAGAKPEKPKEDVPEAEKKTAAEKSKSLKQETAGQVANGTESKLADDDQACAFLLSCRLYNRCRTTGSRHCSARFGCSTAL